MTTELHVLRVFTTPVGGHGNPLGVFVDGAAVPVQDRQGVAEVDALAGPPPDERSYYVRAWEDEAAGTLRSRYFVPELGIGEDEATGAAAVVMGSRLARPITIRQGLGSILHVRPGPSGSVEVGGLCVLDEARRYP